MSTILKRPVRIIDSRDRDILKLLHNSHPRAMSGHQIANRISMSAPAIKPRLESLRNQGILKKVHTGENRTFDRTFSYKSIRINAPSKILWGLDIKRKKK